MKQYPQRNKDPHKLIKELHHSQKALQEALVQQRESADQLVRSEKLAFAGRMAASVAHEIRNPLNIVGLAVQEVRRKFSPGDERIAYIESIARNMERVNKLVTDFVNCSRPQKLRLRKYNVNEVIRNVLDLVRSPCRQQRVHVRVRLHPRLPKIFLDPERLEQVFLNITLNAVEAMPSGGTLTATTSTTDKSLVVRFRDTGRGIDEKDLIRIFDPFYSTKKVGSGLGLSICYSIVASHDGTISVESTKRKGSTFTVELPLKKPKPVTQIGFLGASR